MRKLQIGIWAILTFAFGYGLFTFTIPIFNQEKQRHFPQMPYHILLIPLVIQAVLFVGGAFYANKRKRREVIVGMLWGFGLEFLGLIALILVAITGRY